MGLITACVWCGKDFPKEKWVETTKGMQSIMAYTDHREVFCSDECHDKFKRFIRGRR